MEGKAKTVDQYRRDIFLMKDRLKQTLHEIEDLEQQCADADYNSNQSYTYPMKMKILEYTLETLLEKLKKVAATDDYDTHALYYATLALRKACQIVSITPEMVYRAVDTDRRGEVDWFELSTFMRNALHLESNFTNSLLQVLDPKQTGKIQQPIYERYLECFGIREEQNGRELTELQAAVTRVAAKMVSIQKAPSFLLKNREYSLTSLVKTLSKQLEGLSVLDFVACYVRCDPLGKGIAQRESLIDIFEDKIAEFGDKKTIKVPK